MKSKNIIIAHKNKLMQNALEATVSILDCTVSKKLSSGVRALRYIVREKPDIAIIQETLGDVSAFEIAKEITSKNVNTKIIIVFENPTYENLFMARSLQLDGCFCEDESKMQILSSVHAVLRGEKGFCGHILETEKGKKDDLSNIEKLSDKEIKIMTLFGFYKNTKKVAQKLDYSSKKIETHQVRIASKLNIDATESVLTRWAEKNKNVIKALAFQNVS